MFDITFLIWSWSRAIINSPLNKYKIDFVISSKSFDDQSEINSWSHTYKSEFFRKIPE